jgi:glyoxylase-like metal-dependent hydrolase (beta-lactamase superfamily II)/8-oxo-dGTP pyrophosphatase MutT (NUDIX family)
MSELPRGVTPATPAEPVDSALGIVLRADRRGRWEVLLGKRSRRARFLAGHLAFPGGKLDEGDAPHQDGAFRRCASRELLEETGVVVEPAAWHECGVRITPPLYPVRFRTDFLLATIPASTRLPATPPTGENESLQFLRPADVLANWERGEIDVPPPVLAVLRTLSAVTETRPAALAREVSLANGLEEFTPRIEFVPGIWALPVGTDTLPPATHTNVWMPSGETFAIVDPGSDRPEEIKRLVGVIRRACSLDRRPAAVLLTHHHRDHVAGAGEIARWFRLPVAAHPAVLDAIGDLLDGAETRPVEDGATIDLGGTVLRALLTEGHAAGHLVYHVRESNVVIAGDLVSALSTILIEPGKGDMGAYLDSLRRVRDLGPRRLLPAHGPPVPPRILDRTIEHRMQREARVLMAVEGGRGEVEAIAAEAYRDTPDAPPFLARMQALAHLEHLERQGRVRRDEDAARRWSVAP